MKTASLFPLVALAVVGSMHAMSVSALNETLFIVTSTPEPTLMGIPAATTAPTSQETPMPTSTPSLEGDDTFSPPARKIAASPPPARTPPMMYPPPPPGSSEVGNLSACSPLQVLRISGSALACSLPKLVENLTAWTCLH